MKFDIVDIFNDADGPVLKFVYDQEFLQAVSGVYGTKQITEQHISRLVSATLEKMFLAESGY